ncbi:MAG: hypothetical protein IJW72_03620 [Alphaproteobacteria bacterium]|nr:hypothetical protein [Alphaproteobacteria bacterium]MBQ7285324.1 hypothetical protein [Alphaproteobacteria bacterium]
MKKILLFATLFFLVPVFGYAQNSKSVSEETEDVQWRANFKRIALELSNTSVSNASEYADSPNAQLSADSESMIKGVFDGAIERETANSLWSNSLFMEYGETKVKPVDDKTTTTENADKILLKTDYTEKMWKYMEADVGPFASLGYQTEFTANDDAPRTKTFRGMQGIKLFNGKFVKELYGAAVEEWDLTYSDDIKKIAYEIGLKAEYPLREGVKFQLESYFRDYVHFSRYEATDFDYEFNITGRMDVKMIDCISLAPYMTYFEAKARGADKKGSNFLVGLSLAYSKLFDL